MRTGLFSYKLEKVLRRGSERSIFFSWLGFSSGLVGGLVLPGGANGYISSTDSGSGGQTARHRKEGAIQA